MKNIIKRKDMAAPRYGGGEGLLDIRESRVSGKDIWESRSEHDPEPGHGRKRAPEGRVKAGEG